MLNFFFSPSTDRNSETIAAEMITQSMIDTPCYVEMFRGTEVTRKEQMEFIFRKNLLMMKERNPQYLKYHFSEDNSILECFFMLVPNSAAQFTTFEKIFMGGIHEFVLRYGYQSILRLIRCSDWSDAMEDEVMKGYPKYYVLQRMVVHKSTQGKGVGSKYLGNALKKADEEQVPVFLTTQEARNVTFYGRL